MPCSQVQLARVVVRVLVLIDVVCVMLVVLIAHVDVVHAVDTVFVAIFVAIFCSWRCTLYKKRCRSGDGSRRGGGHRMERVECEDHDALLTRYLSVRDGSPVAWKVLQDDDIMLKLFAVLLVHLSTIFFSTGLLLERLGVAYTPEVVSKDPQQFATSSTKFGIQPEVDCIAAQREERWFQTSHDDIGLELFKEQLSSPTLMQFRDKRRGVARFACCAQPFARISTSMSLSGKHVDFNQCHLHDYGDGIVARTIVRLDDNDSLKTGLQHPEGERAVRDVELVRWHAELHEDVDGQDTASEQVRGD